MEEVYRGQLSHLDFYALDSHKILKSHFNRSVKRNLRNPRLKRSLDDYHWDTTKIGDNFVVREVLSLPVRLEVLHYPGYTVVNSFGDHGASFQPVQSHKGLSFQVCVI